MSWRTLAMGYLVLQGFGAIAWWLAILFWPASRRHLVPDSLSVEQFGYLLSGDAILFIGASFVCAIAIWQRRQWAALCLAVHAGAAWYAGAYAWTASIRTNSAWASALLMLGPMIALAILLRRVARETR